MRHCVLVCMDATVCNIACRLTNWSRWYNAWITNGTLACQVLTGKVKKCKNWPQWDKRVAHRPLEWSSENQIMSLCWSAVHALTQRSTSIWKGYACPYNCLFLCKVTFSDSPPRDSAHFIRLPASHASAFLPSEAIMFWHCLKSPNVRLAYIRTYVSSFFFTKFLHISVHVCHIRFLVQRHD